MKKTLYIIVLTLCFVLALIGKSYGQGWVRERDNPSISSFDLNIASYSAFVENHNKNGVTFIYPNMNFDSIYNYNDTVETIFTRFDKNKLSFFNKKIF